MGDEPRIEILGAHQHNLRIDSLSLPKGRLVVFTGVSGSGKSSLAFDTLHAEGQRRYIESLSSYARQFLGRVGRPEVERLRGLSPTIAIEQKSASSNPRSTVGTITELYDYLRVLYARAGEQHCHICGNGVKSQSPEEVVNALLANPQGKRLLLTAPLVTGRKGEFRELFDDLRSRGFLYLRIDGEPRRLDEPFHLNRKKKHDVELVVDRISISTKNRARLTESVELALREGKGELLVIDPDNPRRPRRFSETRACCGRSFPELSPQSFSFNSPLGMCLECNGLGTRMDVDPGLVVPDPDLTIRQGAIAPWASAMSRGESWTSRIADAMCRACQVDLDTPWKKIPRSKQHKILHGMGEERIKVTWGKRRNSDGGSWKMRYEGVIPTLARRYRDTSSENARAHWGRFLAEQPCEACGGRRLRPESLAVRLSGKGIDEVTAMTVEQARDFFGKVRFRGAKKRITEGALREVNARLQFLLDVGLDYLTANRSGPSLSGGEAQRIRLASQLGSELSGVLYVLDEPSIGLHQRDNRRLIKTLKGLRDRGNSVIVVEHDEGTIRSADHVVDFGPGAGLRGGRVVFSGTPAKLCDAADSLTGLYLSRKKHIPLPVKRRRPSGEITIRGATENNLKDIDVKIPLSALVAVSGVSGAGKSSLINGILLPALSRALHDSSVRVGRHRAIEGIEALDRVISIDQKPIGRTPRSNPGTYTKAFDEIRRVFAQLPEARMRGFKPARFSFNVKGGACAACRGDGVKRVEMHFLADVHVPCEVCNGLRYNFQTLQVKYRGRSVADVLDMTIDECLELFGSYPKLARILRTLAEVGLGYLKLGQTATTLSGGEAQRVKLSRELGKRGTGHTLYVLDEPTTGLHFEDINRLLDVLHRLTDLGNTVVIIEHNLEVLKCADWLIDLGPEGGDKGGRVVAQGPPEKVARAKRSHTGRHLSGVLDGASASA
jgi:excinuclease ABC subunit A